MEHSFNAAQQNWQKSSLGIGKPDRITGLQLLLLYNREILETLRYTISVYRYS